MWAKWLHRRRGSDIVSAWERSPLPPSEPSGLADFVETPRLTRSVSPVILTQSQLWPNLELLILLVQAGYIMTCEYMTELGFSVRRVWEIDPYTGAVYCGTGNKEDSDSGIYLEVELEQILSMTLVGPPHSL